MPDGTVADGAYSGPRLAALGPIIELLNVGAEFHFVRFIPTGTDGLFIFGHVDSIEKFRAESDGWMGEETDETIRREVEHRTHGIAFGKCHSLWEPEGEYGSTPANQMVQISNEQFEQAQNLKWDMDLVLASSFESWREPLRQVLLVGTGSLAR
jgi:hypothetical protein